MTAKKKKQYFHSDYEGCEEAAEKRSSADQTWRIFHCIVKIWVGSTSLCRHEARILTPAGTAERQISRNWGAFKVLFPVCVTADVFDVSVSESQTLPLFSSSLPSENELPSYDSVEEKASYFISLTSVFKAVISQTSPQWTLRFYSRLVVVPTAKTHRGGENQQVAEDAEELGQIQEQRQGKQLRPLHLPDHAQSEASNSHF